MLLDFLKQKHECNHKNVPIDVDEAYCPDCGALIKNKPNCGATDFYIQELDKVSFIDVHYAIFKKIVIPQNKYTIRQVWIEKEDNLIEERQLIGAGK